jgi:hypothetical protein
VLDFVSFGQGSELEGGPGDDDLRACQGKTRQNGKAKDDHGQYGQFFHETTSWDAASVAHAGLHFKRQFPNI